jgi:hypothetical protein
MACQDSRSADPGMSQQLQRRRRRRLRRRYLVDVAKRRLFSRVGAAHKGNDYVVERVVGERSRSLRLLKAVQDAAALVIPRHKLHRLHRMRRPNGCVSVTTNSTKPLWLWPRRAGLDHRRAMMHFRARSRAKSCHSRPASASASIPHPRRGTHDPSLPLSS